MNDPRIFDERDALIARAADVFHVTRAQILGKPRGEANVAMARQIVYFGLRQAQWNLVDIGAVMHRDHSSVHHGIGAVERRIRASRSEALLVESICQPVKAEYTQEYEAIAELAAAAGRIHDSIRGALELMRSMEAEARAIRQSIAADIDARNVITRGAA